jgi:hypothetical protein
LRKNMAMRSISSLWLALALAACGSQEVCRRDPVTGWENCQTSGSDYGEAAGTAVAAAAAWAAVGCTVNGCAPPSRCNPQTKLCEALRCSRESPCPGGYDCEPEQGVCR